MCLNFFEFLFPFTYYGRFNLKPSDTPSSGGGGCLFFSLLIFALSYCELHILFLSYCPPGILAFA